MGNRRRSPAQRKDGIQQRLDMIRQRIQELEPPEVRSQLPGFGSGRPD